MKSKTLNKSKRKPKKPSELPLVSTETSPAIAKLSLFDHVKHIRAEQDPSYYNNLSDENKKSFNHFMLLRALSMDDEIVQEMAFLYRYINVIPSAQFYQLLISLVPKGSRWIPWVKTKVVKHSSDVLSSVAAHYKISKRQANEYINVLLVSEEGRGSLSDLFQAIGLAGKEVNAILEQEA